MHLSSRGRKTARVTEYAHLILEICLDVVVSMVFTLFVGEQKELKMKLKLLSFFSSPLLTLK